jgi:hypothetical protein
MTPDFSKLRLFFWQRQTTPNWRTMYGSMPMGQFHTVHLHSAIDPGSGPFIAPLEFERQAHNVTITSWFEEKAEFLSVLNNCNVFFSPRNEEGIGMALLEAMQRGMVCIANNAPTMSEYIVHTMNGYLVPTNDQDPVIIDRPHAVSASALYGIAMGRARYLKQEEDLIKYLQGPATPPFRKAITPTLSIIKNFSALLRYKSILRSKISPRAQIQKPKISIVTVVRNDASGLLRTIGSVADQSFTDFEYLIIDGDSTDKTKAILKNIPKNFAQCISEADDGPYDAMNKATHIASGEYILFLNAGDTLFSHRTLEFCVDEIINREDVDVMYGHHVYIPQKKGALFCRAQWLPRTLQQLQKGQLSYDWLSGIPCHQATITKTSLLRQRAYDHKRYKIAADHDFLFDVASKGAITHHCNFIIANYSGGGMSSRQIANCVAEWRAIATHYSEAPTEAARFYDKGTF